MSTDDANANANANANVNANANAHVNTNLYSRMHNMHSHTKFIVINSLVAFTLFFGGVACIVWSVNIKKHDLLVYDVITTGTVTTISPLALSFDYVFLYNGNPYTNTWLPTRPFVNSTRALVISCVSTRPDCNTVLNVPGQTFMYGFCGPIILSAWFWPILMSTGIVLMTVGSVFVCVVAQRVIGLSLT